MGSWSSLSGLNHFEYTRRKKYFLVIVLMMSSRKTSANYFESNSTVIKDKKVSGSAPLSAAFD